MAYSTEDKKYPNIGYDINPIAAGLMAAGDSISGIYGQRGNTYATYLDAQAKRRAFEIEVDRYAQTQALAQSNQDIATQLKLEALRQGQQRLGLQEQTAMSGSGFIPSTKDTLLGLDPITRMQSLKQRQIGDITGRTYIPKTSIDERVDPKVVEAIASFNMDPKLIPARSKGLRNKYLSEVLKVNPNYDDKNYRASSEFVKGLTNTSTGKPGAQIQSFNQLASHVGTTLDNLELLKTSNIPAKNVLINFLKQQTGNKEITNVKASLNAVQNEFDRYLKGIGVTNQEIAHTREIINENSSYDQIKSYLQTVSTLAEGRVKTLEQMYKNTLGKDPGDKIIFPSSRSVLNRFGNSSIPKFSDEEEKQYQAWKASQR